MLTGNTNKHLHTHKQTFVPLKIVNGNSITATTVRKVY